MIMNMTGASEVILGTSGLLINSDLSRLGFLVPNASQTVATLDKVILQKTYLCTFLSMGL